MQTDKPTLPSTATDNKSQQQYRQQQRVSTQIQNNKPITTTTISIISIVSTIYLHRNTAVAFSLEVLIHIPTNVMHLQRTDGATLLYPQRRQQQQEQQEQVQEQVQQQVQETRVSSRHNN